jgi:methionyl-tRNA formyltransferase
MRLVFMGTPAFAVPSLQLLAERGLDVAAVVTQPDRPVGRGGKVSPPPIKEAALRLRIAVHQPPTLRSPEAVSLLRELSPEAIVVVAYGQILRRAVLDLPPLGCVNVHPSLLPKLRGASPIQSAIREGHAETGVTIMLMNERMDAGPILSQASYPIFTDDTAATLGDRLAIAGAELLVDTLPRWKSGIVTAVSQAEGEATYCAPLRKEDANVEWSRSAIEIARACRAQTPWPGCQTWWEGRQLRLVSVRPLPTWEGPDSPGTVLIVRDAPSGETHLAVATGRGALELRALQLPGKRAVAAGEFLRGYPSLIGGKLGPALTS